MNYPKYRWLNEESQTMLNRGYLLKGETVEDAVKRITESAAKYLNKPEMAVKFAELIENGWLSLSSPIWSNMGTERGLPISCYNSHVPDSMQDIMYKVGEVAIMTKLGGGTSGYFGELRPRGAAIKDNGESNGPVSFMRFFDTTMDVVSQGKTRRGSFAAYLDIGHKDIKEFLNIRSVGSPIQELLTGVCVPNYWMQEMIDGDKTKREIWAKVLQSRKEKGIPYIFFTDNVNNNKPQVYKEKGLKINASNLCVAPNTAILTRNGYETISDLENKEVDVWNGEEWSTTVVRKTGTNQKLLRVTTNSGYELDCTHYHKFYVQKGYNKGTGENKLEIRKVQAKDLKAGDKLIKFKLPVIKGTKTLKYAYENGFYSGDGCLTKEGQRIYLYHDKIQLVDKFNVIDKWRVQKEQNRMYGHTDLLEDKYFVPNSSYTIDSRLDWLAGYLDADGCVTDNNGSQSLQIASVEKEFLKEVQLMLQTLGCDSKITFTRKKGKYLLPKNDGSGELGYFNCKEINRLLINGNSLFKLSQLGLKCDRLKWDVKKPNRECSNFIKIQSIEELNKPSDTYCFTEQKRGMGMFNGILTGQCSEIALPSSKYESFVCCLASMNLEYYDEWKDTDAVELAIWFLDAVMSEFIDKSQHHHYLKAAHRFASKHRSLGLGVMALHSYYQKEMIPFESIQARALNKLIFKNIQDKALKASQDLAKEYGEPELLKGYGLRNTTLIAIAPTTSSSSIMGQVSPGIEPFSSNYYKAGLAKGNFIRRNKYLKKLLQEKGIDNEYTWRTIMLDKGSVKTLDELSDEEKAVFKTFAEISQAEIIKQAADRQKYIDQSQSLNLNIPFNVPPKEVNKLIIDAWKQGIKTLYYQRSNSVSKEFLANMSNCVACEG